MIRVALLLLPLVVVACQSPPRGYLGTDIFEDVPAPKGATYLESKNESFSYKARTFRSARFAYQYDGTQADVVKFYRETMTAPPYSWTYDGDEGPREGSSRLMFSKGEDKCEIDVDRIPRRTTSRPDVSIIVRINYRR